MCVVVSDEIRTLYERYTSEEAYRRMVPKGFAENLRFRKKIIKWGSKSKENANVLWAICSKDFLFWVNTFVWAYDPRNVLRPRDPFITYKFQDDAFAELIASIGNHDILTEKSRDMGASWMFLLVYLWFFQFSSRPVSFMCVSRKEDLVDKKGDPDSLFWKIDYALKNQPEWLKPDIYRKSLHFTNLDTDSTIDGESTTGDVGRGGRRTSIALDEFAAVEEGASVLKATSDNTNNRLFNSTPMGVGNKFYEMRHTCEHVLTLHWSKHPIKAAGLYRANDKGVEYLDSDFWQYYEGEYPFIRDGELRSPWYDRECKRRSNKQEIAQELNIDYLASDYQFFDPARVARLMKRDTMAPFYQGDLFYDETNPINVEFIESPNGRLKLWLPLIGGRPAADRQYRASSDVAGGTKDKDERGASNSVTSVGDMRGGCQVAELAAHNLDPVEFAAYTVALCRWFQGNDERDAFLIWEGNGPTGLIFQKTVIKLGFRNFYYREKFEELVASSTNKPGWWSTAKTKPTVLAAFRSAMGEPFIIRSSAALDECKYYVSQPNGTIVHRASTSTDDPTQAREAHGDRIISLALLWWVMKDAIEQVARDPIIPPNCLEARRRERQKKKETVDVW